MQLIHLVQLFVTASVALNVTAPTADEVIDITKPFNVKWTSDSTDPAQVSIDVVNATANQEYVLVNNVRGANVSEGNYKLRWANAIPSETAAYRLVFLDYATGGYLAQSPIFNLTLPPGEVRNTSAGDAPASPGTSNTERKASSTGLPGGELAAAIIVPILALIAILVGALYLWRRKRNGRIVPSQDEEAPKSKNDHESAKPELDANGRAISNSKHRSVELAGEKDLIKWELPSTPPRKSIDPVEMPAEVPLAEMSASAARHELGASENGSTIAGSTAVEDITNPPLNQDNFARDNAQIQSSTTSPDIADAHEDNAASTIGRSRFQEALYDIISDELRRPEAAAVDHRK